MIYSVQQIKFEILAYIKEFGGDFNDWYVGIAADPKGTLFQTHKVHQEDDIWLHKQALTFTACKTIQKYFLDILKTDGKAVSEGDEDTDCIYLYKKSSRTTP
jgi:hypothetical protein